MARNGSINEEGSLRDVPRFKSELEDVDFAVYKFVDESLDIHSKTNKGFGKVPVVWAGSERAHNSKNTEIERDTIGMVTLPIISIERGGIKKSDDSRVIPYAKIDPVGDLRNGSFVINKVIKQDKTSNFSNADAYRQKKQQNFPLYRKNKNKKIVYETLTIPIPIYVDIEYKIALRTEYQEQMNDLVTPFIRVTNAHRRVLIPHASNQYEAFIEALNAGDKMMFKEWEENTPYFDGCMQIEIMASRGPETLRFGPMKPVGLTNSHDKSRPYAVVQLRQDNML
mgnify:CR=1 FL=1